MSGVEGVRPVPFAPEAVVAAHVHFGPPLTVPPAGANERLVILITFDGWEKAQERPLAKAFQRQRGGLVILEPRATGLSRVGGDSIGRAPDHNSAEWALWLGRPLLGQWAVDVRRLLDLLEAGPLKLPPDVLVIGEGPAGLVALAAAATDKRITQVAAVNTMASFVTTVPYGGQRLGTLAPGILRDVGDVGQLGGAVRAEAGVMIAGGVSGGGTALPPAELAAAYAPTTRAFQLLGKEKAFVLTTPENALKELGLGAKP